MSVDFTVNGELFDMPKGTSVANLLTELDLNKTPVTTKINGKMLMRKDRQQEIQAGDQVDIRLSVPVSCVTVYHEDN